MVILRPGEQITNRDSINIIIAEPSRNATTLADAEREHLEQALIKCGGVVGGRNVAARLLALPRSTLQYRQKKYGLDMIFPITFKKLSQEKTPFSRDPDLYASGVLSH